MKSVLINIDRKYCYKIAERTKSIDIRRTIPDIEIPFKCYIYEPYDYEYDESYVDYDDEYDVYCYDNMGKVIGEFVCDYITTVKCYPEIRYLLDYPEKDFKSIIHAQMPLSELISYANGNEIYGLNISDLVIYDDPKELNDFIDFYSREKIKEPPQKGWFYYVESGG